MRATVLRFLPYPPFESETANDRLAAIATQIESGHYEASIAASRELLRLGLQGLRYLQTYDWLFLRALVTLGYLGWMAFAMTTVIDLHVLHGTTHISRSPKLIASTGAVAAGVFSYLVVRSSPLSYYLYAAFPILFWEEVLARQEVLVLGRQKLLGAVRVNELVSLALKLCAFVGLLELLV